ncbi:hypothetical protein COZ84_00350, partial [Candidatus Kuenenbacteria bacterium CG_4_8_14_3_um_filter_39_15]
MNSKKYNNIFIICLTLALVLSQFLFGADLVKAEDKPDLIIESLTYRENNNLYAGYTFDGTMAYLRIKNQGSATATNFEVGLYTMNADTNYLQCGPAELIDNLGPGESKNIEFTHDAFFDCAKLENKEYYLKAYVDYNGKVDESNEDNNIKTTANFITLPQSQAPQITNIVAENISDNQTKISFEVAGIVNPMVRWAGGQDFSPFQSNNKYKQQTSAINDGGNKYYAILSVSPSITYHYRILFDYYYNVTTDDLNFQSGVDEPDLMFSSSEIGVDKTLILPGETVTFGVDAKNNSEVAVPAGAFIFIKWYVAGNEYKNCARQLPALKASQLPALKAGWASGITCTVYNFQDVTGDKNTGTVHVQVKIDPDNTVAETNETNNKLEKFVYVGSTNTSKSCVDLRAGDSTKKYFDVCKTGDYGFVCFDKHSGEYNGCSKNLGEGCTINNTQAIHNISCSVSADNTPPPPVCATGKTTIIQEQPLRGYVYQALGLDISTHPEIMKYRIRWFNGSWSAWYIPGQNDIDWKTNLDGSKRRVWAYFDDHVHEYEKCLQTPQLSKPDLTVESIEFFKKWSAWENVLVAEVCNRGTAPKQANIQISTEFSINGQSSRNGSSGVIEVERCINPFVLLSDFDNLTAGNYNVKVETDKDSFSSTYNNKVDELNENNNSLTKSIYLDIEFKTCSDLKSDNSNASNFEMCKNYGYSYACFNKYTGAYQGCVNNQTCGSLVNSTFSGDSIKCETGIPIFEIKDIAVKNITHNSADITWKTAVAGDSHVSYVKSAGTIYDIKGKEDNQFVTDHSISLTDLTPNTLYKYVITSYDEHGHVYATKSLSSSELGLHFTTLSESAAKPDLTVQNFKFTDLRKTTTKPWDIQLEFDIANIGTVKPASDFKLKVSNLSNDKTIREGAYAKV